MGEFASPVRQIAYFCGDVRRAALDHHRLFGSGPFFVLDRITLARATYRGAENDLVHSSAYGQFGSVMVEFVQQDSEGASPFREMFAEGETGLHHVALFEDDLEAAVARFASKGHAEAFRGTMDDGFQFVFIDTLASLGHMVELYRPVPALVGFYDMVADAAAGWNGDDPVRILEG
jgi:hypothetical protein